MTSGLETEWDYSGRKGRDGQKTKIGKANERKGKVKGGKDEEVNGQRGKRCAAAPHGASNIEDQRQIALVQCINSLTSVAVVAGPINKSARFYRQMSSHSLDM